MNQMSMKTSALLMSRAPESEKILSSGRMGFTVAGRWCPAARRTKVAALARGDPKKMDALILV